MFSKDYYVSGEYKSEVIGVEIFKKVSQLMPMMVYVTRASDFSLLYANRKVSEFLGLELSDLHKIEGRILNMVYEPDIEKLWKLAQEIHSIKPDQALKLKVRMKAKNGSLITLETSVSVFQTNEKGEPTEFFFISEDITEKEKLEQRADALEEITRTAEETFRYGAWEWFPDSNQVIWSKGIYDIFEKNSDEPFPTADYVRMIHPEDLPQFTRIIAESVKYKISYTMQYRIITSDHSVFYLREQGKPVFDQDGNMVKFIGTIRDVSDYWETLYNLNKYEVTLQQAELQMKMGTWEWRLSDDMARWSEGFWNLLEYDDYEKKNTWVPAENYLKHFPPPTPITRISDMKKAIFAAAQDGSIINPTESTLITCKGNMIHVVNHFRVLEYENNLPSLIVGSTADVTLMKNIQKNLENKVEELAKAYKEMEEFAYIASHDLQEPLRKVTTFGERLQARCGSELNNDGKMYLDRMLDSTARMRLLIDNLLVLSRTKRQTDFFTTINLNDIMAEVENLLESKIAEHKARLIYQNLPTIEGIPTQMDQLFMNLLSNALKFVKPDRLPEITITSNHLNSKEKDELNLDTRQEFIYLQVQDNGIGFEQEFADTIFAPFKRLHGRSEYEGTGIGLAICKKVVQNHNGRIWATATPGQGACFHIVLPYRQAGS